LEGDGKVVGLGTSMGPVTFYHVIEDSWDGFPISTYSTPFAVRYIDTQGETIERTIRRFKPELAERRSDNPHAT
jgi:aminoglycoside 3-N-acetyltransferase